MTERCLCPDYDIRGQGYEVWVDGWDWYLADPRRKLVVEPDDFDPPLTEQEVQKIADCVHDSHADDHEFDRP